MTYSPERIALWGMAVYLLVLIVAPVDVVVGLPPGALGYILLCYAAFFLGCWQGTRVTILPPEGSSAVDRTRRTRLFWILFAIGLLGMALRFYDKYFLRPVDLTEDVMVIREALEEAGTSPFGALGGILYPACYLPLFLYMSGAHVSAVRKWAGLALFLLPAAEALIILSRSSMLVAVTMLYFSASVALYRGQVLPRRVIMPALVGFLILVTISIISFNTRMESFAWGVEVGMYFSSYAYTVQPSETARWLIADRDSILSGLIINTMPLMQYYIHGIFEFGILWDQPTQSYTFGALTFAPYVKAFTVLGLDIPAPDFYTLFPRVGVFTGFFGPLWVDFGWVGPLAMVALGTLAKVLGRQSALGRVDAQPLYCFLAVVVFFMPVVNLLVGAQGMYVVNAFAVFWLALRPRRLTVPFQLATVWSGGRRGDGI